LVALWVTSWVAAVVNLVSVSWRQVVSVGQVTRLVMHGTVAAMVGAISGGTLLWVWVALLVACWAMMSSRTAETHLWVWGVLLVADLAVTNSVASVGSFPIVSLWWVWVEISLRWAVISYDASVGQVTRMVEFAAVLAAMATIGGDWLLVGCSLVGGRVLLVFVGRELVLIDGELLLVLAVWQLMMVGMLVEICNLFWLFI
jgi:hypothetical protein